jgi:cell division transport system ATP-binding protein
MVHPMIKFDNVALRYDTGPEILHDLNFSLTPGSFHFLTGPSGAGKSSLMRLLYLGMRPTRGKLSLFSQDIHHLNREELMPLRRQISVVFQDFRLLDHLSVFDNVALPLRISNRVEKEITTNVTELLKWVGLGDHMHSKPSILSGGQKQRVAIARAVVSHPRLLLADEPTGNLDDQIGMRLMHLFDELHRMGTTIVVATHNQGLVEQFGHPQLHLNNGTVEIIAGLSAKAA